MKKTLVWALLATLFLFGCGAEEVPDPTAGEEPTFASQSPVTEPEPTPPPATEAPTEMPTEAPTETPTEAPTSEPADEPDAPTGLYLVKVPSPEHPIHEDVGYETAQVGTVSQAGTYTILEEVRDDQGNTWGRLKSGIGWIDVTGLSRTWLAPLSVDYASESLVLQGGYESLVVDDTEYTFPFVLYPHQKLTEIRFTTLELADSGYQAGQVLGTWDTLSPELPLVVWASFPGDLSAYGILFTDEGGQEHRWCISISGRDGSMILSSLS